MASSFKKDQSKINQYQHVINGRKRYKRKNMTLCLSICKTLNKNMKYYDKNQESSYIQYWDVKNLYGWGMLLKLPINNFEWMKEFTSQFNEDFTKTYNEKSDDGYFLEVDVQYLPKVHKLYNDLLFLPERMKIENVKEFVANLHDKTEYVIHI